MQTDPILIDRVARPVVVETRTFGNPRVLVGGIPETGRRNVFQLPVAGGGTVSAKVRDTLLDAYPVIEIDGVKHRTGPETPKVLQVLCLLPWLMVIKGGLVGATFAAIGFVINRSIVRSDRSTGARAALMVLATLGVVLAYLFVAVFVWFAMGQPE